MTSILIPLMIYKTRNIECVVSCIYRTGENGQKRLLSNPTETQQQNELCEVVKDN